MSQYVTLIGAEQVLSAGNRMSDAADRMQSAAASIGYAVDRLVQALDDHARRIEAAAEQQAAIDVEARAEPRA